MLITIYVALAQNSVIGNQGTLPWRLSSDLKRFRSYTMGKAIVMGKKTWSSLPGPLAGRYSIVLSHDPFFAPEGVCVAHSISEAISSAATYIKDLAAPEELVVIGGNAVFSEFLPFVDCLHITYVLSSVEGDVFFPEIDFSQWNIVSKEDFPAGEKDEYPTSYVIYERIKK